MEAYLMIRNALNGIKSPTIQELKWTIANLGLTIGQMEAYVEQPSNLPYGRTALFKNDDVEAVLIHLPGHAETAIHDHGSSAGCGIVLSGEMENIFYKLDAYRYPVEVLKQTVGEQQVFIAPKGQIHKMRNTHQNRLVTFHIYTPVMVGVSTYKPYEQVLDFVI
ncbi:cysteine dioxygenase [Paenibacillus thalictri]|uniref:Cysteine dioxygenase n=1 Tax=Paenibacillus thalictri TaxID=2527873 RepID=A0A4Q9DP21_9BACL|nr:cysteine dioxygenase family protein [Paenibacillus thalictri]TBL77811.1 cysteine dioxygenase [Paenibacillus thalictri]